MTQAFYVLIAVVVGLGSAIQVVLLSSLGRQRGSFEATWISVLVNAVVLAVVLGAKAVRGTPSSLPSPFDSPLPYAGAFLLGGIAVVIALRGVEPYLALAGIFGFTYLVSAAFLSPRIGIALFSGSVMAGTLLGSVVLDHFGAFGTNVTRISAPRVLGVIALLAGVILIRGNR